MMRAGLTMLIAMILSPLVPAPADVATGALVYIVGREVMIGLSLSMGVRLIVFATEAAGQLLGYQLGLSYGSIVDPQSGVRNTVLSSLYSNLAIVLAFADERHAPRDPPRRDRVVCGALPIGLGEIPAASTRRSSPRPRGCSASSPRPLAVRGSPRRSRRGAARDLEVLLGLMARLAPSFNIMVVGAPARLVVGLLVVAATLLSLPPLVVRPSPITLDLATPTPRAPSAET